MTLTGSVSSSATSPVFTIETFDLALADTVIYLYDNDGVSAPRLE